MRRRTFLIGGSAAASSAGLALLGDAVLRLRNATDAPSIGILSGGYVEENIAAFHQGLRDHGWIDGHNVTVYHEDVLSKIELLPERAALLVSRGVRLIVATGPSSVSAVVGSYPSMPVVIAGGFDPVRAGFIRSFAEPSANVTGVAVTTLDTKRVEMLKQLVLSATRLAFITNLGLAAQEVRIAEIGSASDALGIRMRVFDIRVSADIEPAFESASAWGAELSIPSGNNPMANARLQVVTLAARRRLPAMYSNGEWVKVGRASQPRIGQSRDLPPQRDVRGQDPPRSFVSANTRGARISVRSGHEPTSAIRARSDFAAQCAVAGHRVGRLER